MMPTRERLACGLLALCMLSAALAQSPFDGQWKLDSDATQSTVHYDYLLQNGSYRCSGCDPPIEIPADGKDHKIAGEPCYDTVSVTVIDARTTEEIDKRNGKTVGSTRIQVSADGNTATVDWAETCNAKGVVVSGKDIMIRLASGPAGAHAISGSWKVSKRVNRSENAMLITLKLAGDHFSFWDPAGQGYDAKLDGTETPFQGDLSHTFVSVRRLEENSVEETDKRDGKVVQVSRFVVASNGKDMTVAVYDKVKGTNHQWVLHKQ